MLKKWIGLLTITILFLLIGCTAVQEAASTEQLAELDTRIEAGEYGDINSLLIWHDGVLLLESYYRGTDSETMNQIYSVTKSITSAMVGKAVEEQHIASLNDPMLDYFPENRQIENLDGRKEAIVLADLLTMQAGFEWEELSTIYGDPTNDVTLMTRSADWIQYMLDREMLAEPGTTFTYSSGVTMLLGTILQVATGQSVEDYTATHLFEPLDITDWRWQQTPTGSSNTGWGLFLRPADMLKFGQLYYQEGNWQGNQIIPEAWIAESTRPLVQIDDEFDYGYQWWRFADESSIVADLAQNDVYFAWGFGGNFIFVVPHMELIVVTTAENFENSAQFFSALQAHIFPAFE